MIPTVTKADEIGRYPVIAQWTDDNSSENNRGECVGEYVVLVGPAAESKNFKRLEDAVEALNSIKREVARSRNRNEY